MFGPVLDGIHVRLEPPRPEDAPFRIRLFTDLETTRLFTSPDVPSEAQERESYERASRDPTVVLWRVLAAGEIVGSASLMSIDLQNGHALSSTLLDRDFWGKGYGSEVVRLRAGYAFELLGLQRLETSSIDINVGMHRALERCGYRRIMTRRRRFRILGEWRDEFVFELLRDEWRSQQFGV